MGYLALRPRTVQIREQFNHVHAFNDLVPSVVEAMYVVGSKRFRPDIQKPHQMENAVRDI